MVHYEESQAKSIVAHKGADAITSSARSIDTNPYELFFSKSARRRLKAHYYLRNK